MISCWKSSFCFTLFKTGTCQHLNYETKNHTIRAKKGYSSSWLSSLLVVSNYQHIPLVSPSISTYSKFYYFTSRKIGFLIPFPLFGPSQLLFTCTIHIFCPARSRSYLVFVTEEKSDKHNHTVAKLWLKIPKSGKTL